MTDNKMQVNLREIVVDILLELEKSEALSHIVIGNALTKYQYLEKQERSFIMRAAQGTIEKQLELDYIINQFSKTPVKKQKPFIRCLLRMSVYQLKYMDNVPASAVCNEAVKLAVRRSFAPLKGFVNGVLRNISRNLDNISYPDESKDVFKYLSVKYSFPEWLLMKWADEYDIETVKRILNGFENEKSTYIRCNTSKVTPDELKKELLSEKITVSEVTKDLGYAFKISDYDYLMDIRAFAEGWFQVQDISSMLAGEGGIIGENDYIIDVCAAPGGKSINAALKAVNGYVEARDISDYKVSLIENNIERLGISNISCKVWDATVKDEEAINKADVVIADLPCSGLGIIGRKPDIKYNASEESLQSLAQLQRNILSVIWDYVKPGGYMIYSTCTINKNENQDNVEWFCNNFPFEIVGEPVTILPDETHTDGFFIARLRKDMKN